MAERLNDRQRKFAERIVAGDTATAAYLAAFPRTKSKASAQVHGSELLKNSMVAERIKEMRAKLAQDTASKLVMDKKELLEFLTKAIRTPADEVEYGNPLVNGVKRNEFGVEIKVPDKLTAAAQLAKLLGFNEADQVTHGVTPSLAEILKAARERRDDPTD